LYNKCGNMHGATLKKTIKIVTKLPEILQLLIFISTSGPLRKHLDSLKPRVRVSNGYRSHRAFWRNYQRRMVHNLYVNNPILAVVRIWTLSLTTPPFTSEAANIHGHFPHHALVCTLPKHKLSTEQPTSLHFKCN